MRFVLRTLAVLVALGVMPAKASPGCPFPCFEGGSGFSAGGFSGGSTRAITVARQYLGGNPTGRSSLWCGHFMNFVERKVGRSGTGSGLAKSFASYGRRVSSPRQGDIAVLARRGGGHVGYVLSSSNGKVKLISGNHGNKVGIGSYPRSRVIAFVRP